MGIWAHTLESLYDKVLLVRWLTRHVVILFQPPPRHTLVEITVLVSTKSDIDKKLRDHFLF